MKTAVAAILIFIAVCPAAAQPASKNDPIAGVWKGTSICQVKNSPCHDENVVYYISKVPGVDTFNISASKIVNGKEEDMGLLGCKWDSKNSRLLSNSYGQWTFNIKGNTIDGTLYHNGTLYRIVKLVKQS